MRGGRDKKDDRGKRSLILAGGKLKQSNSIVKLRGS